MTTTPCRSCRAPILWRQTERQAWLCIDPEPADNGTVRLLDDQRCEVLAASRAAAAREAGETLYRSHWASCPNAKQHRKRR